MHSSAEELLTHDRRVVGSNSNGLCVAFLSKALFFNLSSRPGHINGYQTPIIFFVHELGEISKIALFRLKNGISKKKRFLTNHLILRNSCTKKIQLPGQLCRGLIALSQQHCLLRSGQIAMKKGMGISGYTKKVPIQFYLFTL